MRKAILGMSLLLLSAGTALAQKRFTAPLEGTTVLRDVEDKYNAQVFSLEAPEPDGEAEAEQMDSIKRIVSERFPRKHASNYHPNLKTTAAQMPVISRSFVADSFPGIPPDNHMAMNHLNDKVVSVMNSSIAVLNAQTGQMLQRKTLKSFSSVVGLNGINDYRYDPKVIYDPEADRFIAVMLNSTDALNYIVLGFSQTNDPTGAWNFYKFYGDYDADTTWFDYPIISITKNEFFLTGNKLIYSGSWQTGFRKSVIYQVRKQDGYSGAANLNYQIWDDIKYNGVFVRNLFPVKGGASLKGPEQYFLSNRNFDVQNDTVFLVKLPDTIGSANQTLTVSAIPASASYGVPPEGRQPDLNTTLATNDGRILGAFREGNEIQFVSASANPNGASAVYHGIISNFATTPTAQAHLFTIDTLDFGYPNLSYAGSPLGVNESIISFNFTGPNTFPGLGAIFFDGNQYSDLLVVKSGDSIINRQGAGSQRWGDYSGSQIEWNHYGIVWILGIYGRLDRNYGNYMARLQSPDFNSVSESGVEPVPNKLYPNPAWKFIELQFELKRPTAISFAIYDAQGRQVDAVLHTACREGANIIQFNVASLPAGVYFLKGTDEHGKQAMSKSFVRQ